MFRWLHRVILSLLLLCLVVIGCERKVSEMGKTQLAQWEDLRARRLPEGTMVSWSLQIWGFGDYHYSFRGMLAESPFYEVVCTLEDSRASPEKSQEIYKTILSAAKNDWVRARGRFRYVDDNGRVVIALEDLQNLGPGH